MQLYHLSITVEISKFDFTMNPADVVEVKKDIYEAEGKWPAFGKRVNTFYVDKFESELGSKNAEGRSIPQDDFPELFYTARMIVKHRREGHRKFLENIEKDLLCITNTANKLLQLVTNNKHILYGK